MPYRVRCRDDSGALFLVFFHVKDDYLERILPVGTTRVVSGRVEHFNNQVQITHPDHILDPEAPGEMKLIEPVYRLTAGLSLRVAQKAVTAALSRAPDLPEWCDAEFRRQKSWPSWHEAILAVHAPASPADLLPGAAPRARLAYDELLANQLTIALMRAHAGRLPGRAVKVEGKLRGKLIQSLPFKLHPGAAARVARRSAATWRRRTACCGCSRAMSAAARRWWR